MTYKLKVIVIAVLAASSLGLGGRAHAQAKSPVQTFGTVDVEKVFDSFDKKKQLDEQLKAFYEGVVTKLQVRQTNKLLSEAEFKELTDLKAKPKPTDPEKARIQALLARSLELDKELQTLEQKPGASDAEKARLAQLQALGKASDDAIKQGSTEGQNEYRKMQMDLSKQLIDEIDKAITVVAKDKSYTIVFNRSVRDLTGGIVAYSNADITDDVLKKLNKK